MKKPCLVVDRHEAVSKIIGKEKDLYGGKEMIITAMIVIDNIDEYRFTLKLLFLIASNFKLWTSNPCI